jgi:hypothetical protein
MNSCASLAAARWPVPIRKSGSHGKTLQSIATASKGDPKQVMEELGRRHLIRPVTTQGPSATYCLTRLSMTLKPLRAALVVRFSMTRAKL